MAFLSTLKVLTRCSTVTKTSIRFSGHGHQITIEPTKFGWARFKDLFHFYLLLGIIPLSLITAYANIVVGQAELTEIPEGYIPEPHEYYKSPVSRFMAKHLVHNNTIDYETAVSRYTEDSEKRIMVRIENALIAHMSERADNKAWFYRPFNTERIRQFTHFHNNAPIKTFGVYDTGNEDQQPLHVKSEVME